MKQRGFTLLEMLVATAIMGIAVVGLLSNLSTSMRNAANLAAHDRAAVLARQKMDELLADQMLPLTAPIGGKFSRAEIGDVEAGWDARLSVFEAPPNVGPGTNVLQRIDLTVWWESGNQKRTLSLDGYRPRTLTPADVPAPHP